MRESKRILITGAGKRVGHVLATYLAGRGHEVIIHYNSSQREAVETVNFIAGMGGRAYCIHKDLSADPSDLIQEAQELAGPLDCVINNASLFEYDDAEKFSYENLEQHLRVNFMAPIALQMALMRCKKKANETGQVIHILDQKLINPNIDYFSYTLSKESLFSSLRFSAMACAPTLRINAILPGHMFPSEGMAESQFDKINSIAALGKSNTAEDVAMATEYFLNTPSVTGQWLAVDGGCHLIPSYRDVAFLG